MVVKSLKYLTILFSCITSQDLLITWHRHINNWHLIPDTWYLTLIFDMPSLDTRYLTLDIWHLTLDMLSPDTGYLINTPDIRHLIHYTCYLVLIHLTWCCDIGLDTITTYTVLHCLFMIIAFTGTWHDYYTTIRYLVLLNSYIPESLKHENFWYYTPGTILLLIPVIG